MARVIYIVNATQVVTSESNPQGAYSVISGYPKTYDSRNYDGDIEKALRIAQSEFFGKYSELLKSDTRAMWTVTLERSDGRMIDSKTYGAFPAEPTPEEQEQAE